jgi:hypothetical protein
LWHCVGHILHLRARLCRRRLKFGSGFHKTPYVAAAKAVRRSLEGAVVQHDRRAPQQSKINGCAGTLNSRKKELSESGSTRHMWGAASAISSQGTDMEQTCPRVNRRGPDWNSASQRSSIRQTSGPRCMEASRGPSSSSFAKNG